MTKKPAANIQRRRRPKSFLPSGDSNGERYHSKAIGRALDILDCFHDPEASLNLKEISDITRLSVSSLFRVLVTLEVHGYLQKNEDGTYLLSSKVLFGRLRERAEHIRDIAHPFLEALARNFNETASMAYLFDDHIQVLDSVDSYHEIRHSNRIGRVLPPHCSSMGKAITAFQKPARADLILEGYGLFPRTSKTIVDRHILHKEFEKIRQQGYAFDRGEAVEGGICVGVPIVLESGSVCAAVSLSVPVIRMNETREKEVIQGVLATAAQIGKAIQRAAR
ncbi:MAG: IclR family transcriptional regulator [Terriglobia bacterium]|nr:IclR family transcriptional regulator [Terriglobia bacterium]